MLGSIDANTGDMTLGWDTDQFCTNVRETTMIMLYVLKMGGFKHGGGLNFDAKNRRESTDLEDFFIAHIGGMDAYARGLKAAAALLESGVLEDKVTERYHSPKATTSSITLWLLLRLIACVVDQVGWLCRYSSFDTPLGKKLSSGKATLEEFEAHAKTVGAHSMQCMNTLTTSLIEHKD